MLKTMVFILVSAMMLTSFPACAASKESCSLPPKLKAQVTKNYPDYEIINKDLLNKDDLSFFEKDHGETCPGIVKVDFFGSGRETYAIVVTKSAEEKSKTDLIVATLEKQNEWAIAPLHSVFLTNNPVVWSEAPGNYKDILNENKISSSNPVVLLVGYESWAILFAWDDNEVKKIWISD